MRFVFLVAMGLVAAAPALAQSRPPLAQDLNLGVLGATGAIAPVAPPSHVSPSWSYHGSERVGRPYEPPLSHMPVTPGGERWRH